MQAHLFISGYVQGIGYRQFVKTNAVRLGLTGWVRNLSDNRVEAVFQGDKKVIEKMLALCRTGPMLAEIKDIAVIWEKADKEFKSFETETSV